jgi:aconitate hydratase 2/2-methylisocitrate dehydratase
VVDEAVKALSHTLLVYDAFNDVEELHKAGNAAATKVIESWQMPSGSRPNPNCRRKSL